MIASRRRGSARTRNTQGEMDNFPKITEETMESKSKRTDEKMEKMCEYNHELIRPTNTGHEHNHWENARRR